MTRGNAENASAWRTEARKVTVGSGSRSRFVKGNLSE
jgi:hypothetical protein